MKKKTALFTTAYSKLQEIEDNKDLKTNQLSLSDYDAVYDCMKVLSDFKRNPYVITCIGNVAAWFIRQNFKVTKHDEINYKIEIC